MNLLAINGSPHGADGNTAVLQEAFLAGARSAGARTDVIELKDKTIHHCIGCYVCWTRTPGVCIHQDDMTEILERIQSADILVYTMPLYVYTMPGLMKDFVDRCLPLAHPAILKRGDHFIHPQRWEGTPRRSVLISNAGFPETHHFDGLKRTFQLLHDAPDREVLGMICCGAGPLLRIPEMKESVREYLEAAFHAGTEVVNAGRIQPETQAILDRSLASDPAVYANLVNAYWRSQGVDMPSEEKRRDKSGPAPHPGIPLAAPTELKTVRDVVAGMPQSFRAEAAASLSAVIQFEVSNETPGRYFTVIENGCCASFEGEHPHPNLAIRTPRDVWLGIARGELSGATAYMTKQYTIAGDMELLMNLHSLFSSTS